MKRLFKIFLFFFCYHNSYSHNGFIENKGQIHDQNIKPNTEVKYLLNTPGMNIQLKANSFSYDTYTIEQKKKESTYSNPNKKSFDKLRTTPEFENIYHFHRVDVQFIGANPEPEIISEGPSESYSNYYTTGTDERGATKVRSFEKIIYKNLYPNIDLEFLLENEKVKYNFILHYGANISDIRWKYNGAETAEINKQNIKIKVKQGLFTETIPESFIGNEIGRVKNVNICFDTENNSIFHFISQNNIKLSSDQKLIIDPSPNLLWATYFGNVDYEYFVESCLDKAGNIYMTGMTTATAVSIATSGAFQTTYGGGIDDVFLTKFNSAGILKWCTYYGGSGDDLGNTIVIDKFANLFIAGYTSSTISISTSGSHQVNFGGGTYDAFIAKFDTSGFRQWGSYYGGTGFDDPGYSDVDTSGNFYITGITTSTNAISTGGAYQTTNAGGTYDAFLVKFNNNGVRQWGTYYGSSDDDEGYSCDTDLSGNIYFTGMTTSSVSISTSGVHQTGYGGGGDILIVKFNSNGVRKWATYCGGSGKDRGFDIHFDPIGSLIYICGDTKSTDSIATLGTHQITYGGGSTDAFLMAFDTSGTRKWGTYYGGSDWDGAGYVNTDNSAIYICGNSRSFNSIATPNAYQTTYTGGFYGDAILVKFSKNGMRQWGTYYGGPLWDYFQTILLDASGAIYTTGVTTSASGISTSGSYQPNFGGFYDAIIVKFDNPSVSAGLDESTIETRSLTIFPNPNNGSFTLLTKDDITLNIVNELGQLVKTVSLNDSNNHQFIVSDLECGVYFLMNKNGGALENKIVVIK